MQERERLGHIDAMRGLAALVVAYFHITQFFMEIPSVAANGTLLNEISYQLGFGRLGVLTFFAISGFVICPTLTGDKARGVRRFVISRFFRLFPAFWASMFLMLAVQFFLLGQDLDLAQVLGNLPMLYPVFGVAPVIGVYWTLEVELLFYFLCVVLFALNVLHRPLALFGLGLALMACSEWIFSNPDIRYGITQATGEWVWAFTPWNLAIMFWGGLFRMWYDDRQRRVSVGGRSVPLSLPVFTLLGVILLRPAILIVVWVIEAKFWAIREMFAFFLGLGIFVVGALFIRVNNRFLVWLGTISYSVYLLHIVGIHLVHQVLLQLPERWMSLHMGVYLVLCLAVCIGMSAIVYYLIEKPAIRKGRELQKRLA